MARIGKFVAVVASIALFVMPAATMRLHCLFNTPSGAASGQADHSCHHTMEIGTAPHQFAVGPIDHSCCQFSAETPESLIVPQSSAAKGTLVPPTPNALSADLLATPVLRELPDSTVPSRGGPPQAVLCTFLI